MALLMLLSLCGCNKVQLYGELAHSEANDMLAVLANHGIYATKQAGEKQYAKLMVDYSEMAEANIILKKNGYPRKNFLSLCKIFEKGSLISSPMEEKTRFLCALQQSLSKTIAALDGVNTARVHLVLAEQDVAQSEAIASSASIFIKHREGASLSSAIPTIKLMVSNAVKNLDYTKISIFLSAEKSVARLGPTDANTLLNAWHHSRVSQKILFSILAGICGISVLVSGIMIVRKR